MFKTSRFKPFIIKTALSLALVGTALQSTAKEGMWMPKELPKREADMKAMGLEIPVSMLYNEAGTGLNNAVVLFGKGCTGEIISSKGLLLTNHHCGYGTVQGLSSKDHDYFANGFWAKNTEEELPCPGLTVTFIRKMENVTPLVLNGIEDTMEAGKRNKMIAERIKGLEKGYRYTTGMEATIKPYYNGNQYWVAISETFRDVRLVGFPPNGVGVFGGDTDNWMWPRHTGDFSMFRVYAGKDNKPADYDKNNKPYQTRNFFKINVSGYKEGDFTMVYGFPAQTMEYISSYRLNQINDIIDPVRIEVRTKRLNVWKENMSRDRDVFLKYTSKKASVANGWKKWQGEVRGLNMNNVAGIKTAYERDFQTWAQADNDLPYADDLLSEIGARSVAVNELMRADEYIKEAALGIELVQMGSTLDQMLAAMRVRSGTALQDTLQKLYAKTRGFYKNYDVATDKQVFTALMPLYFERVSAYVPANYRRQFAENGSDYNAWANYVFTSRAADSFSLSQLAGTLNPADSVLIQGDPAWLLYTSVSQMRNEKITPRLNEYYTKMAELDRLYMNAQLHLDKRKEFYPDANQTLRLAYGNVKGIDPDGPAGYSYQTNLDEAVAKVDPNVEEFNMPEKLKDLHEKKDYGRWAVNGTVPIAFIANNHTSGGNSGSPVLNARGELIGTNFDRIWEGTMSDLYFDSRLCRNISLDVRYTLFIVEKLGGAGWLLKEMELVKK